jgi:DNA-binding PadR family transcriptional regulator
MLTKLEEQILMAVWKFHGEGYGVNIFQYLERILEKKITMGVVYDTMERLRKKGYLETFMGDPTPVRGGMRKKFYKIADDGIEALVRSKTAHDKIMEGFNDLLRRYKKIRSST